jgi:hypothetical protein
MGDVAAVTMQGNQMCHPQQGNQIRVAVVAVRLLWEVLLLLAAVLAVLLMRL